MEEPVKIYCEHGALTSALRSLKRKGRIELVYFPYDPDSRAAAITPTATASETQYRDLNGLVAALQKGGLNAQVQSWLGPGANLPITEDQLKAVLGNAQLQEFARHLGLPVDATLKLLAQYLPDIVDKASPNGTLQTK